MVWFVVNISWKYVSEFLEWVIKFSKFAAYQHTTKF